ncbi:MAG: hypothetical protein MR487_08170 [Lachnospiraceae bacterium]|nr:hypothetical protein [Lachnospiraceae bacterium]
MDRQDINRVTRTIRSLMSEKRYEEVVRIAEKLNLGKVNNGLLILNIVEAYENLGEKAEAKNTLFSYYDVHGITGRNMMQKLIELCIETGDISNAVGLCIQFENEWPDDSISYLMRYQITASGNGSYDEQIHYLEKYKEYEFEERWGYELARLYEKNNQWEDCARICHELICFFGDGKYVEKAVRLKERIDDLTDEEISILEAAQNRRKMLEEEFEKSTDGDPDADTSFGQDTEIFIQQNSYAENQWNQTAETQQTEFFENDEISDNLNDLSDSYLDSYIEESEDALTYKTREAEADKIRQTEEAAKALRIRKENERIEREQKIADVFSSKDRYAQVEKGKVREIHFQEFSKPDMDTESSAIKAGNKGILSSLGKVTEGFRKTLHTDDEDEYDYDSEVEYITIGRESRAYIEDIEERMLSELDMLDDEQIDRLTSSQIKEIYELKVLREVREKVAGMLSSSAYKYDKALKTADADMETFIEADPYQNPIENLAEEEEIEDSSAENELAEEENAEIEKAMPEGSKAETTETEVAEVKRTEAESAKIEEAGAETTEVEETKTRAVKTEENVVEVAEAEAEEVKPEAEEVKTEGTEAEETEAEAEAVKTEETEAEETEVETVEMEETENETVETEEAETVKGEIKTEGVKTEEDEAGTAESEETESESNEGEAEKTKAVVHTVLDDIADPDAPLSNEMFLKCVISCAEIMEYRVEETAYMTIAVVAEEMQEKNVVLSLNNAKILTEQAVQRAQKRSHFDKIFDKYNKKRMHILKDRHFYWK